MSKSIFIGIRIPRENKQFKQAIKDVKAILHTISETIKTNHKRAQE